MKEMKRSFPAIVNIFSNLAGGGWIAVLTVIITPVQVNILGMEAYGLISIIVTLQAICNVLDFGLSATLTRELAMDHSVERGDSQPLVTTVRTIYWGLALFWGSVLMLGAGPICRVWFHPQELNPETLVFGMRIIAVYLALRWPVAFFSSILSGLQRMDLLNLLKASTNSLRLAGGVVVLFVFRDLKVFLWWTLINVVVEIVAYSFVCGKIYPLTKRQWSLSWSVLKPIWHYAIRMNAIGILAVLIAQADRLQVSKLLSMEALGFYSLAYTTVSSVSLVLGAISSALLPSFSVSHSRETLENLVQRYYKFSSMTLFLTGFLIFSLMFFGQFILSHWVSQAAAAGAWEPLAWLAGGFWFSIACSNAYTISIACGRPDIPLKISLLSASPYFLLMAFLVRCFGINGPAMAWLLLNVFYIVSLVPLVHRKILKASSMAWLLRVFLSFSSLGMVSFGLLKYMADARFSFLGSSTDFLALVFAIFIYGVFGLFLLGKDIRQSMSALVFSRFIFIWRRAS